jgi:Mg2+-importing ATPase
MRGGNNRKWLLGRLFSPKKRAHDLESIPKELVEKLLHFAALPSDAVLHSLSSRREGLTQEEAEDRLEKFGPNQIISEKPPSWGTLLLSNFYNPFVLLLSALSILSFILKDFSGATIILIMVIISVLMRFTQEYRSNQAAASLKALITTKATVRRGEEGKPQEIPFKRLVPGDIIQFSAGDMLPADVYILSARDFFLSQATLTGESLPVEKQPISETVDLKSSSPFELPNICLMGTNVVSGIALGVVIATGSHTFLGAMAKKIIIGRPLTSFDIGISKISWLLLRLMFLMVPLIFIINGLDKHNWFEAMLFALSVAVGLTPELLPMIVTANLAKGATNMSKSRVIVKRLNSIQNFGAMTILCTDKTGTLTQDRIVLEQHLNLEGDDDIEVLRLGFYNSHFQSGLKNLLDVAVLEASEKSKKGFLEGCQKLDEIPFDFNRKRMSVVVQTHEGEFLISKGSLETILPQCSGYKHGNNVLPLDDAGIAKIRALHDGLNLKGLRVLAVALCNVTELHRTTFSAADESSLILIGFFSFLDPPKKSVTEALSKLNALNIGVKVLTGDNEVITERICQWVNLTVEGKITGPQMQNMSPEELEGAVEKTTIFARLDPLQKAHIIALLRKKGHVVGYLGDGINDAAALREADLGISVDTAVDIAKESSDIIMLEKSLLFLVEGVKEGRRTFGNIIKYIKMSISSNFGNVFSILGSSILLPFLPMLPVQLLLQNLLYDISQLAIPFDTVDASFLRQPRKWDPRGLARFMFCIGPISSIFDYVTFGVLWFFFHANSVEMSPLFQTGWFIEGLFSQTLIVHMIRTEKFPFIQSFPSLPLLCSTLAVMIIGLIVPYTQIGQNIGMTPLHAPFYLWLIPILLGYFVLTQIAKYFYIKKFHTWL